MNNEYGKLGVLQHIKLNIRPEGVFGYDQDDVSRALDEYAEMYHEQKIIEGFQQTPATLYTCAKKAKEIALDAAVQILCSCDPLTKRDGQVVDLAKEIYQWLTEPETDKR
jgi:hypothetical protein